MEGQHRVGALTELPQVLRDMGQNPGKIIADAGISQEVIRNPENVISFGEVGRLLQSCVAVTGCSHFGLLVGQRSGTASLGLIGRLMRNAPTLKDAILDLCVNQRRYVRGAVAYLVVRSEIAQFGYSVLVPGMQSREQLQDGALAVGHNILKELAGIAPSEVHIARHAPQDVTPYQQFFGIKPRFNAEQYALVFPSTDLDRPVIGADRRFRKVLEHSVGRYRLIQQQCVSDLVLHLLRAEALFRTSSLGTTSEALRMHPRTLKRRLRSEGTSWRILNNRVRFEVACDLLGGTKLAITDVSIALNYADVSAFTHAFHRSAGVAPNEWRNRIGDSYAGAE